MIPRTQVHRLGVGRKAGVAGGIPDQNGTDQRDLPWLEFRMSKLPARCGAFSHDHPPSFLAGCFISFIILLALKIIIAFLVKKCNNGMTPLRVLFALSKTAHRKEGNKHESRGCH